jgi:hypothetical protein
MALLQARVLADGALEILDAGVTVLDVARLLDQRDEPGVTLSAGKRLFA